ncbi:unnamed protein product, partial [Ectocarpus fasciculatus]
EEDAPGTLRHRGARLRRPLLPRLRQAHLPWTGSVYIGGHDRGWRKEAQVRQGHGGHGSFRGSTPNSRPEGHASPYELQLLEP